MNEIYFLILSQKKNYLLHNNVVQQIHYFDTNILSRGYSTKFQGGGYDMHPLQCKMEIPGGVGGLTEKFPPWGGWIFSGTTQ